MLYTGMIEAFIIVFILSAVGSLVLNMVFRFFGKKGYLGNLYPNVRGGIPRAIGLVPFIILCFFFLPEYNTLVLIMGLLHFWMMFWEELLLQLVLNGVNFSEVLECFLL